MKNLDAPFHTLGESVFVDDIIEAQDMLHAVVFTSGYAHAKIKSIDYKLALEDEAVQHIFTAKDIPGENQIGAIIQDEELLADKEVHYIGQPIAILTGKNKRALLLASEKITMEVEELPIITDPRVAFAKGELIAPPRTFVLGAINNVWENCDTIIEGKVDSAGQEHFYLETQSAYVLPTERGGLKVHSSTQSSASVQKAIGKVLGLAMHKVEVDVRRLGGAFGGKEDQASPWAAMAALAAFKTAKPVKLVLDRKEDLTYTGKRHPYSSDYKIGFSKEGKILGYEVSYYQNAGASADLSTSILERTLFHLTNAYTIPHVKATAISCRTNLPPFTAYRGFGGPQGMFVIEAALHKASKTLGISVSDLQKKNLLQEDDMLPYGMKVEHARAIESWEQADTKYNFAQTDAEILAYNNSHASTKKGLALMPICFGISFTNIMLNQARALVHVYTDGSVSVSTGAVEMGQGVNVKLQQIAALSFGISVDRVKVETTNTTRVANASPTAASSAADMNGKAVEIACLEILQRLKLEALALLNADYQTTDDATSLVSSSIEIKDEIIYKENTKTNLSWKELVLKAYRNRVNLSSKAHFATPDIYFDKDKEKGKPFAYHVFGTAGIAVTLDVLRGTYNIDFVRIVHDAGKTLNKLIDLGQVEGALLQGLGWMTMEELIYSDKGKLLTNSGASYKVPDIKFTPKEISIDFLDNADNPYAVLNSKAVGEPPFMYGIAIYFALLNAIQAVRPEKDLPYDAPLTPEKVLGLLYD